MCIYIYVCVRYTITVTVAVRIYGAKIYKNPSLIMIMRAYRIYLCIPLLTGPFKFTPYLSAPPPPPPPLPRVKKRSRVHRTHAHKRFPCTTRERKTRRSFFFMGFFFILRPSSIHIVRVWVRFIAVAIYKTSA